MSDIERTTQDDTPEQGRVKQDRQLAEQLVERAKEDGLELVGPDGVLTGLTKRVLEAGLEAEMSEHLGYDKHDPRAVRAATPATAPARRRC